MMPTDEERRAVARNIRENYARGGMGYIPVSGSSVARAIGIFPSLLTSHVAFWNRLADLIEPADGGKPAAWRDFAADPPSEKRPVLCKSRNGRYYVGSPCFFANDTFTGEVWVPRGGNYRRPEKWMEIDAATRGNGGRRDDQA